jgi:hypothetical protein
LAHPTSGVFLKRQRIGAVAGPPEHSEAYDAHGKLLGVFSARPKAREAILRAHFGQLSLPFASETQSPRSAEGLSAAGSMATKD